MGLDVWMRTLFTLLLTMVIVGTLSSCGLLGGGRERKVPEGDAWRGDVIAALEGTPGVTSSSVTVHDMDSGTGYKGPLVEGSLMIDGDVQSIVDDALLRMSEVLGPDTNGVHIGIAISVSDGPAQKLREFGYDGVGNGAALWDATH